MKGCERQTNAFGSVQALKASWAVRDQFRMCPEISRSTLAKVLLKTRLGGNSICIGCFDGNCDCERASGMAHVLREIRLFSPATSLVTSFDLYLPKELFEWLASAQTRLEGGVTHSSIHLGISARRSRCLYALAVYAGVSHSHCSKLSPSHHHRQQRLSFLPNPNMPE